MIVHLTLNKSTNEWAATVDPDVPCEFVTKADNETSTHLQVRVSDDDIVNSLDLPEFPDGD